ncbi:hypothetical protein EON63_15140 [archaeon]|nr:MAG: hypothetical protein EON63_15140 [archaeon]
MGMGMGFAYGVNVHIIGKVYGRLSMMYVFFFVYMGMRYDLLCMVPGYETYKAFSVWCIAYGVWCMNGYWQ